jgi:aspartyl-tRNA(Asn)/glutamyl-tRNA(Gln) amidotransferase subunit A
MPLSPYASAVAIRDAILRREVSAEEVCRAALDRIAATDGPLHAFLHVGTDSAIARARRLDAQRRPEGLLHGVPVALKDNICTRDMPTTAGSRILDGYRPAYDATVVTRLEQAGAIVVGKTVCDEFAMGSSTDYSAYGPSRNPWAPDRTPGGSSGGSAVAVAAGMVPIAFGSDTGGSIRQPASFCGVTGLKPTYGRVSRYGLVAFASSLDQIGPFARRSADAALALAVVSGADARDATAAPRPPFHAGDALRDRANGARIGVPYDLIDAGVDPDVRAAFEAALATLVELGARIEPVALPHSPFSVPVYYLVATAEASSNLARYDGVRYGARVPAPMLADMYDATRSAGFGPEVKRRIMLGTYVLSAGYYDAYYRKAQQVRTLIRRDFERAFERVDVIALPTSPTPPFRLGERVDDPLSMYLADTFTVAAPLAGLPAVSLPAGFTRDRLPIGVQLTGRAWDEAGLLGIAQAFEGATGWADERPLRRA